MKKLPLIALLALLLSACSTSLMTSDYPPVEAPPPYRAKRALIDGQVLIKLIAPQSPQDPANLATSALEELLVGPAKVLVLDVVPQSCSTLDAQIQDCLAGSEGATEVVLRAGSKLYVYRVDGEKASLVYQTP